MKKVMVMDGLNLFILTTKALDAWQNAIANNTAYSLECRMRQKKWCYFWWLVRAVPALDKRKCYQMVWNMHRYTKHQRNRNRIIKS
jgi:hypothetical protein